MKQASQLSIRPGTPAKGATALLALVVAPAAFAHHPLGGRGLSMHPLGVR